MSGKLVPIETPERKVQIDERGTRCMKERKVDREVQTGHTCAILLALNTVHVSCDVGNYRIEHGENNQI